MCRASALQRKRIGPAMSSGGGIRWSGIVAAIRSRPPPAYGSALISVSTHPGATQLTVMSGAHSIASDLVIAMRAPLVAA